MAKDDYEKLLKRIENNISQQTDSVSRFELPMVDITWEGKKTILRNFISLLLRIKLVSPIEDMTSCLQFRKFGKNHKAEKPVHSGHGYYLLL